MLPKTSNPSSKKGSNSKRSSIHESKQSEVSQSSNKEEDISEISIQSPIISPEPISILVSSGLADAVTNLFRDLARKGLPTGNIYEYAAKLMVK